MNNPHLSHLADQVGAANMEQSRLMTVLAESAGGTSLDVLPPFAKLLLSKLAGRLAVCTTGLCPHLSAQAPLPSLWTPWFPGLIRCEPCFLRVGRNRLASSGGNQPCDSCGRFPYRGMLRPGQVGLPGAVWDVEGFGGVAVPPVTVTFGLCLGCSDEQGLA